MRGLPAKALSERARTRDWDCERPFSETERAALSEQAVGRLIPRFPVVISKRLHPIPSRTRKLSSSEPMVLHGKPCGRVGRCRDLLEGHGPPKGPVSRKRGGAFGFVACPVR